MEGVSTHVAKAPADVLRWPGEPFHEPYHVYQNTKVSRSLVPAPPQPLHIYYEYDKFKNCESLEWRHRGKKVEVQAFFFPLERKRERGVRGVRTLGVFMYLRTAMAALKVGKVMTRSMQAVGTECN